jgi:hypothetical protein
LKVKLRFSDGERRQRHEPATSSHGNYFGAASRVHRVRNHGTYHIAQPAVEFVKN